MLLIANHILNAEPVYDGSRLYKATRADGTLSAVQILPFDLPLGQYDHFQQQMDLLSQVQSEYHAAVPEVLHWGFTKTGSYPYMETEWINGINLFEKRLKDQSQVFELSDIMKIAEQISRVLTLCHNIGLQHGALNLHDVFWDSEKSRYVLTGFNFGLASENVSRDGSVLFAIRPLQYQDVHDLGQLLLQLLVGDILIQQYNDLDWEEARVNALPSFWSQAKTDAEKYIPAWLAAAIRRALSADANERFKTAAEMYNFILLHHKTPLQKKKWYRSKPQPFVRSKTPELKKVLSSETPQIKAPLERISMRRMRFVFDPYMIGGLIIAVMLTGFSIEAQKKQKETKQVAAAPVRDTVVRKEPKIKYTDSAATKEKNILQNAAVIDSVPINTPSKKLPEKPRVEKQPVNDQIAKAEATVAKTEAPASAAALGKYKVRSKAYFHNEPDESTRRNAFIVHWNNAVLRPQQEENDFVYIVFTNIEGQTTRGWLRKKDLIRIDQ